MDDHRKSIALAILDRVQSGTLDTSCFTADASWWINSGQSLSIPDISGLLSLIDLQVDGRIAIRPGLVLTKDDYVIVEATSDAKLKSGGHYANRYLFLFHFEGDLVRQVREYNDTEHVSRSFTLTS